MGIIADALAKGFEDLKNGVDNKQTRLLKKMTSTTGLTEIQINGKTVYDKEGENK